jgi:FKBP-type peptidyl-prolyl cis-trans isomerase FkpA
MNIKLLGILALGLLILLSSRYTILLSTKKITNGLLKDNVSSAKNISNIVYNKSGLTYEIIKKGKGAKAQTNNSVTVHYSGWLNEKNQKGKEFGSSVKRNDPFTFSLGAGQVIKGWDEGVEGMQVGETRRLYIPANLAYGQQGISNIIPANTGLIFDVELLAIN